MNTEAMDQTLAFTAVLELHPGGRTMTDAEAQPIRQALREAMTAAQPKDRWAFAKAWLGDYLATVALAEHDEHGARYARGYTLPYHSRIDFRMALAIARSAHPKRVLAHTGMLRYGEFREITPEYVTVWMMGNCIARFRPEGVQLSACGRTTATTSEALSNLVTGGYFYHDGGVLIFSAYESTGSHRTGTPAPDGAAYPYKD